MKKLIFALACLLCAANGFAQEKTPQAEDSVYTVVQEAPEYSGGRTEMFKFIRKNFRYPKLPAALDIQGRVIVRFIVRPNGKVDSAHVVKGLGHGLDEEALRVVEQMPDWKPCMQNGRFMKCYMSLPIVFKSTDAEADNRERILYIDKKRMGTIQENEALIHKLALENKPFKIKKKKNTVYITFAE